MWKGQGVLRLGPDERGRMNLYSYDVGSKQTKKLTTFTEFDVKFPSMGDGRDRFRERRLDLQARPGLREGHEGPVRLARTSTRARVHRGRQPQHHELRDRAGRSRALFGARGDVFTVPAKFGPTRT